MNFTTLRINRLQFVSVPRVMQLLAVSFGLLLFCLPVFSQLNLGRILGGITDQTGGAIAGATVTVLDVERGVSRPLTTDGAGEYSAPSLIPGTYTVRAEAKGFKTVERQNILLGVGQDLRVDLILPPGEQTQTVTVSESLPMLNTTNATLSATLDNQTINELPLNGREYEKLLEYKPGTEQNGLDFRVNGNRANANVWMLDGIDDYNAFSASGPVIGGQSGFDESTILPVDSIQEVNIIGDAKAEYGWKPGAQVNVGLKSGTNSIHGTAYAFGRDTALDAKNAFLGPLLPKATDELKQYGASIGGPLKKDKLFYFGNYEGQRYTVGSPKIAQIPTTASVGSASNSFQDAITAMEVPTSSGGPGYCNPAAAGCARPLSQLSLNLAGCTLPAGLTGTPSCNAASGIFGYSGTSPTGVGIEPNNDGGSDDSVAKIDYHLNDHNAFNAEYLFGLGNVFAAGSAIQPYWVAHNHARADVIRGVWVWTPNSTWVNEARFGFDRYSQLNGIGECVANLGQPNYATFGFVSGAAQVSPDCGFPVLSISGGFASLGSGDGQFNLIPTWAGIDSVSYTRGKHLFKFGVEVHETFYTGYGTNTNATGNLSFGTASVNAFSGAAPLEDFLAGVPSAGTIRIGSATRHISRPRYAGFVQDDWRLTSRVTVNLGLRYEYEPPISERNNLLGNFDPTSPTGLVQVGNQISQPYRPDFDNFGPRLGLAWDVTGKGTTVVRAGGTVVTNTTSLGDLMAVQGANLIAIPTGFALYQTNGAVISPKPGNIQFGTVTLNGNANPSLSQIPWVYNPPGTANPTTVFNVTPSALACGNGLPPVNGVAGAPATDPAPCALQAAIDPKFPTAYTYSWNLAVQHAFTSNFSLTLAYVGLHGSNLGDTADANQPQLGNNNTKPITNTATCTVAAPCLAEQQRRPYYSQFPYLGQVLIYSGMSNSDYNALEATLTQRVSHGLFFTATYTFSHALDQCSTENNCRTMDARNPGLDYGNSLNDPFNHFTLTATYDIPGRKLPGQLLEGWQINTALDMLGSLAYNAVDTTSDISGTGELQDRWTLVGDPNKFKAGVGLGVIPCFSVPTGSFGKSGSGCTVVAAGTGSAGSSTFVQSMPAACVAAASAEPASAAMNATTPGSSSGLLSLANFGCYIENGSVIVPPAQGTFGSMGRDVLRGKPFREWDFSATKSWKYKERLTAQFRAEFFNVLNRTLYSGPGGNPNSPSSFGQLQSTSNSGNPIVGAGGPRQIQLGLKLIF